MVVLFCVTRFFVQFSEFVRYGKALYIQPRSPSSWVYTHKVVKVVSYKMYSDKRVT